MDSKNKIYFIIITWSDNKTVVNVMAAALSMELSPVIEGNIAVQKPVKITPNSQIKSLKKTRS